MNCFQSLSSPLAVWKRRNCAQVRVHRKLSDTRTPDWKVLFAGEELRSFPRSPVSKAAPHPARCSPFLPSWAPPTPLLVLLLHLRPVLSASHRSLKNLAPASCFQAALACYLPGSRLRRDPTLPARGLP